MDEVAQHHSTQGGDVYRGFICILFIRINTIYPINSPAPKPSAWREVLLLPTFCIHFLCYLFICEIRNGWSRARYVMHFAMQSTTNTATTAWWFGTGTWATSNPADWQQPLLNRIKSVAIGHASLPVCMCVCLCRCVCSKVRGRFFILYLLQININEIVHGTSLSQSRYHLRHLLGAAGPSFQLLPAGSLVRLFCV